MRLIGIGDNVVDYYEDSGIMYPGGNAVNVAVLSKRLGSELCSYIGLLGNDRAGDHILDCLHEEGIDVSRVRRAYGANSEAVVNLNSEGDRIFIGSHSGVAGGLTLRLIEDDLDLINQHDVVHTSVYSRLEEELHKIRKPISFDFSESRDEAYLKKVCPYLTYAFFSGSDLSVSDCHDLIARVHKYGVEIIGITRGAEGALFSRNGTLYEQGIVDVPELIDTMGAGDSFIAGFLAIFHDKRDMEAALQKAAQSASETCSYNGAFGYGIQRTKI